MTRSKREKIKRRILDRLNKAELSNDKGSYDYSKLRKPNRKTRRHSGRYTPQLHQKGKFSEIIANAEEPREEYDNWRNYRDGFRDCGDKTKLRKKKGGFWIDEEEIKKFNKKIKKQIAIRKAKKQNI